MGLAIHLEGICSSIKAAPSKAAPGKAPSWERAMITSALPLCGPHLGWPQPSARWTPSQLCEASGRPFPVHCSPQGFTQGTHAVAEMMMDSESGSNSLLTPGELSEGRREPPLGPSVLLHPLF